MQTGLLWFDSDPNRGLVAKIEDAARRYQEKFGQTPDTCYISHKTMTDAGMQQTLSGLAMRVVPSTTIMPHHFWVGREEASHTAQPA
jgi:hypothetical protein